MPTEPPRPFAHPDPSAPAPPKGSAVTRGARVATLRPRLPHAGRLRLGAALTNLHRGRPRLELRTHGAWAPDPFARAYLDMHPRVGCVLAAVDTLARFLGERPSARETVYRPDTDTAEPSPAALRLVGGAVVGVPGPPSDTGAGLSGPIVPLRFCPVEAGVPGERPAPPPGLSGPVACMVDPRAGSGPDGETLVPVTCAWDYLDGWPGDPLTGYASAWLWGYVGAGLDGRDDDERGALLCSLWPDARGDVGRARAEIERRLCGGAWGADAFAFRQVLRFGYEMHGADDAARLATRYGVPVVEAESIAATA